MNEQVNEVEKVSLSSGDVSPRGRVLKWGVVAAVVALVAGGGVYMAKRAPAAEAVLPARDVPHLEGQWIRYSPGYAERSKITFAKIEHGALSPVVSVTGTVSFDPERVAAIGARIPGRIRHVFKFAGDAVKAGEPIAELESAELGQAQAAVVSARAHAQASSANEVREAQLAEARVSSQRDAELARANAAAAKAELVAAEQKLRALGGSANSETGILNLTSPIAGKVVDLNVSRGQSVEPSLTAARVADLKRVWIELSVFERDLGRIHREDKVEISPQTNATKTVEGKVAHVGDVINLDTRSAPVRVVVENLDESLRPGESVLAKIHVAMTGGTALLLPKDAVVSVDGKSTVFVEHDATSVEPRSVVLGASDGDRVEVVSGLKGDERVVTNGVFALKSEVFR